MLNKNRTRQLKQLRRLDPFAARRVDAAIKGGHLALAEAGIVKGLQEAARNIHQRLTAEIFNAAWAATKPVSPAQTEPVTPDETQPYARTVAEEITQMLNGTEAMLAERARLAAPTLIRKPTPEESQRGLEMALGNKGMSRQRWSIGMGYGKR